MMHNSCCSACRVYWNNAGIRETSINNSKPKVSCHFRRISPTHSQLSPFQKRNGRGGDKEEGILSILIWSLSSHFLHSNLTDWPLLLSVFPTFKCIFLLQTMVNLVKWKWKWDSIRCLRWVKWRKLSRKFKFSLLSNSTRWIWWKRKTSCYSWNCVYTFFLLGTWLRKWIILALKKEIHIGRDAETFFSHFTFPVLYIFYSFYSFIYFLQHDACYKSPTQQVKNWVSCFSFSFIVNPNF